MVAMVTTLLPGTDAWTDWGGTVATKSNLITADGFKRT